MLHLVGLPRAGAPLICFTGAEIAGLGEWLQFEYIEPSEFQRLWRRHPVPARTRASSHPACLSSTIRRPPGGQAWSWRRRRGRRVARGPAEVMRAFVSNRRSMAESDQGISEDRQDPKRVARRRTHKTTGWACAGSQRHIQACDRPGGTRPHGFEVVARQRAFVGCDCDRQTSWQAADDRPDLGQGKRRRIHRRRDGRESSGVDDMIERALENARDALRTNKPPSVWTAPITSSPTALLGRFGSGGRASTLCSPTSSSTMTVLTSPRRATSWCPKRTAVLRRSV